MKKIFYTLTATLALMTSCQDANQEMLAGADGGVRVSFGMNFEVGDEVLTRAGSTSEYYIAISSEAIEGEEISSGYVGRFSSLTEASISLPANVSYTFCISAFKTNDFSIDWSSTPCSTSGKFFEVTSPVAYAPAFAGEKVDRYYGSTTQTLTGNTTISVHGTRYAYGIKVSIEAPTEGHVVVSSESPAFSYTVLSTDDAVTESSIYCMAGTDPEVTTTSVVKVQLYDASDKLAITQTKELTIARNHMKNVKVNALDPKVSFDFDEDDDDMDDDPEDVFDQQEKTVADIVDGKTFIAAIKSLAYGETVEYKDLDDKIQCILIKNNSAITSDAIVSTSESEYPIYASYTDGIISLHTPASKISASNAAYMFYKLGSLTSLDLSHFYTNNVTDMSCMFSNCNSLTSLDLSHFNTNNVTNMSRLFSNCNSLTSLDLSHFDTNNVTDMSFMFSNCNSLTSLDLSHFDTNNVTNMSYMFDRCTSLTSLNLLGVDLVHHWYSQTYQFSKIASDASSITITCTDETKSFLRGNNDIINILEKIVWNIPGGSPTADLVDGKTFNRAIKSLAQGRSVNTYEWGDSDIQQLTIEYNSNITSDVLVSTTYSQYPIYASYYDGTITLSTPASVISTMDMSDMFYFCRSLTTVDFTSFDTRNVTDMREMFYYCESLTTLDLSRFNTQYVKDMSRMFYHCESLTTLNLSSFNTRYVKDMSYMFSNCLSLTTVNLTSFDTRATTDMSGMFDTCESLKSLDLSNFYTAYATDMACMFSHCKSLSSLNLSNCTARKVSDMRWMFFMCHSLSTLDISSFEIQDDTELKQMFDDYAKNVSSSSITCTIATKEKICGPHTYIPEDKILWTIIE